MWGKVDIGDDVSVFFDAFGRVVEMIPYETVKQYAVIMGIDKKSEFGEHRIKYLSQHDGVVKGVIASNFTLNGVKVTADSLFSTNSNLFFNSDGSLKEQIVIIRANSEGKVTLIETAKVVNEFGKVGYDGFTLNYEATMSKVTNNGTIVLDSKYIADNDTICFNVCTDDDERCYVGTAISGNSFSGQLYNVDTDYHIGVVLYPFSSTSVTHGWVNVNSAMYVVESVGEIMHPYKEGETAVCVYAWNGGTLHTLVCEEPEHTPATNKYNYMAWTSGEYNKSTEGRALQSDVTDRWMTTKWKDLPQGAVISVVQNNGLVTRFIIHFMPDCQYVFEGIEDNTVSDSVLIGAWSYGINEKKYMGETLISYGVVQKLTRFGLVVNNHLPYETEGGPAAFPVEIWNRSVPVPLDTSIYIFDSQNARNPIIRGTVADVQVGDKVLIRRLTGNLDFLMVCR